jgi:hypothetical protein
MPFKTYRYNGVTVSATTRRPSSREDKKYMREVKRNGRIYLVHYGDPNMPMRRDEPDRRRAFLTRHGCSEKRDPLKSGWWSCYDWANVKEKAMDQLLLQVLQTAEVKEAIGQALLKRLATRSSDVLVKAGRRWIARYTNNAQDVERDTVTGAGHRSFVERFKRGEVDAPLLIINHDLKMVLGKADRAEIVEAQGVVFPVFSGEFAPHVADELIEKLDGRAMSHGMPVRDIVWRGNDTHSGVIEDYNSIELSVLVGMSPANTYTEFLSKGERDMNPSELAAQLGVAEDVVKALLQGVTADAAAIVETGVDVKAKPSAKVEEADAVEEAVSFTLEQLAEAVQTAYRSGLTTGVETAQKSLAMKARELSGTQLAAIFLGKSTVGVGEETANARQVVKQIQEEQSAPQGVNLSAFFGGK